MRHRDTDFPRQAFADSSGFHALANPRDKNCELARMMFRRMNDEQLVLYTTRYIIAETHALVLARTRNQRLALDTITQIESSRATRLIEVTPEDESEARDILRRFDDKLFSLTDVISFAVMQRLRLRVAFTFDDDFAQAGFSDLRNVLRP